VSTEELEEMTLVFGQTAEQFQIITKFAQQSVKRHALRKHGFQIVPISTRRFKPHIATTFINSGAKGSNFIRLSKFHKKLL
jgi:hypothetical protein